MVNVLSVKMEIGDMQNELLLMKDQLNTGTTRFNSYLDRPGGTPVHLPDTLEAGILPAGLLIISDSMNRNNPQVKMLESEEKSYEAARKKAVRMGYPMIGIGLNYALIDKRNGVPPSMNGRDMIMPMATLTLPVYRKKYNSMIREAELNKTAANDALKNTKNDLDVRFSENLALYRDAEEGSACTQSRPALHRRRWIC